MRSLLIALMLAAAPALVSAAPRDCPPGLHPATTAEMFFGRNEGQGLAVTDDDWRAFVDEEVSPRFPAGLTVSDVYGHWRDADGFVREPSKALFIVLAGGRDDR